MASLSSYAKWRVGGNRKHVNTEDAHLWTPRRPSDMEIDPTNQKYETAMIVVTMKQKSNKSRIVDLLLGFKLR